MIFSRAGILIFLLCVFSFSLFSQRSEVKFGKVSPEELSMTVYEQDSSADALILLRSGNLNFYISSGNWQFEVRREERIKILKESGLEQADISIPYYHKNNTERITNIKGFVHHPNGDRQKLEKSNIFDKELDQYWSEISFSLPGVQVGSVIEYQYKFSSDNIIELKEFYFQDFIPILKSTLSIRFPSIFDYVFLFQGTDRLERKALYSSNEDFSEYGILKTVGTQFSMENVAALKTEKYITTMDDYLARIRFQLNAVNIPGYPTEAFMTSWTEVANNLLESSRFGKQYLSPQKHKNIAKAASEVVDKGAQSKEVAEALYNFVNTSFEYNRYRGLYTSQDLDDCFKEKLASKQEMNLILVALLRAYGFEAHPVLVSTRSHGQMYPVYPFLDQFNYVIIHLLVDNKSYLVDTGNPYRPLGFLNYDALNRAGWLVDGEKSQWISIKPPISTSRKISSFVVGADGTLNGKISNSYKGYAAIGERSQQDGDEDGSNIKEFIGERYPDAEIDSISYKNMNALGKSFSLTFDCQISDAIFSAGDFMYLTPVIFSDFAENPFKLEERTYPVDIPYPIKEKYVFNLQIPDAYVVESIPQNEIINLGEGYGSFRYLSSTMQNRVQIVADVVLEETFFPSDFYTHLKDFLARVEDKFKEQIVLKKKM